VHRLWIFLGFVKKILFWLVTEIGWQSINKLWRTKLQLRQLENLLQSSVRMIHKMDQADSVILHDVACWSQYLVQLWWIVIKHAITISIVSYSGWMFSYPDTALSVFSLIPYFPANILHVSPTTLCRGPHITYKI